MGKRVIRLPRYSLDQRYDVGICCKTDLRIVGRYGSSRAGGHSYGQSHECRRVSIDDNIYSRLLLLNVCRGRNAAQLRMAHLSIRAMFVACADFRKRKHLFELWRRRRNETGFSTPIFHWMLGKWKKRKTEARG